MDTQKCIESRRSVRSFTDKAVDKNIIEAIAACVQAAPSWKNSQTTRLTAISNKTVLENIYKTLGERNAKIVSGAPLLFVVSSVTGKSGFSKTGMPDSSYGEGYTFFDCGLAAQNLCLGAADMGLGTVIMGIFDPMKIKEHAKTPDGEEIIVLIACGYPEGEQVAPPRLPIGEVLRFI